MSKSFKNILNKETTFKSDSKKDILDLFNEERDKNEVINNVETQYNSFDENSELQTKLNLNVKKNELKEVRQTFLIEEETLDKLKDYVHTKKVLGVYDYTQKDALKDAFDLLFNEIKIINRPIEMKIKEANRSENIKNRKKQR